MNWRKVRIGLWFYVAFDLFFGGVNGGFFQLTPCAAGQFTTVTGTVVDPTGLPYAQGTITPILTSSTTPTLNGQAYTPPTQASGLDNSGKFTLNLADNTQLSPGGTQWNFKVCSGPGTAQPVLGKGSVCFTLAAPITISGASQDISTQLQAAALPLTNAFNNPGNVTGSGTTGTIPLWSGSSTNLTNSPITVAGGLVTVTDNQTVTGNLTANQFIGLGALLITSVIPGSNFSPVASNSALAIQSDGYLYFSNNGGPFANISTVSAATGVANQIAEYTGTHTTAGDALLTDNATTLNYAGTGGVSSPIFGAHGTGAGLSYLSQGADNSANCPVNSRCDEAPASITTSYTVVKEGAGPSVVSVEEFPALASAKTAPSYVAVVGTDTGIASAATISTTVGTPTCSTANGGVTTTACPPVGGYAADTGVANAYVISVPGLPGSIQTGLCVSFLPANNASGASTLAVNGYGAIALDKATTAGVAALSSAADLNTSKVYTACSNSTPVWVLSNPSGTVYANSPLTTNVLVKGGGANQSAPSTITDNGTTVSTTEPIVIGTAAGSPGITDKTIGMTTSAMGAQSSASCTPITGMTWNVAANKNYILHCAIPMTFAASATVAFCIGGPGTPTSHTINAVGSIGAAGVYDDIFLINSGTYGTKTTASGAVGASNQVILVDATIRNGATASGTALTLQTAANGANNITVLADAECWLAQQN